MEDGLQDLAARLKARRRELGMSLRDLASKTGLSPAFLSLLERGQTNPTLDSLRKVTNALGVPLLRLTENGAKPNIMVQRSRRRRLALPPGRIEYELLTPSLTKKMVLFHVQATADDGNLVAQPLTEPTEECLVVLSGQIRVCVSGHAYDLEAGDSIYFEGRDLESIHVTGSETTAYISAITPPVF